MEYLSVFLRLILFVIYGAFLEATKTGDFFINIANSIAGKAQGGPAKVAVISSALFGTISGSAVANVVSTGTYTIPLMKKTGYKSHFAAALEAVASSGGRLMPPVMGAAAFVISEMTGVSYLKICLAATIPAILYYVGVFVAVHMEAKRIGLKGLSAEEVLFFVFYFEIISAITPPVALAAYAAAGIADTEPMKTGFTACRIGLASFIVPYMFVLSPLLLMECNVYYMGNINCINWHINSGLRCNWTCCSCN